MRTRLLLPLLCLALPVSAYQGGDGQGGDVTDEPPQSVATPHSQRQLPPVCCRVLEPARMPDMETVAEVSAGVRAVVVGENHDQLGHHYAQLDLIQRLHESGVAVAIGLEQFQQPYQDWLDRYVSGEISEAEMLRGTDYYQRWRYDYRLYRPILSYAREHAIPLIALNLPAEVNRTVAREGVEELDEGLRRWIPREVDRAVPGYADRLRAIFHHHPNNQQRKFENFLESQLYWDEGMAERAADYLAANPTVTMVVVAGNGHVMYGGGIPQRLARRLGSPVVTIVNDIPGTLTPDLADFVLLPEKITLPKGGKIGVLLETRDKSGVYVTDFGEDSAGREAGIEKGDRLVSINGEPIQTMSDVRIVMLDQLPGATLPVVVERESLVLGSEELGYEVTLR